MRIFHALPLLCAFCIACSGCRAGDRATAAQDEISYYASGQWGFRMGTEGPDMSAGLVNKSGKVDGRATIYLCGKKPEQTSLSGSVTRHGDLTLSTGILSDGVTLTMQGRLSPDGLTFTGSTGAYLLTHCRASQPGVTRGMREPLAFGDYKGDLLSASDGRKQAVTVSLHQTLSFGSGGDYPVGGSVLFPEALCSDIATMDEQRSSLSGDRLVSFYKGAKDGREVVITLTGRVETTQWYISVLELSVRGGPCDGFHGVGRLIAGP